MSWFQLSAVAARRWAAVINVVSFKFCFSWHADMALLSYVYIFIYLFISLWFVWFNNFSIHQHGDEHQFSTMWVLNLFLAGMLKWLYYLMNLFIYLFPSRLIYNNFSFQQQQQQQHGDELQFSTLWVFKFVLAGMIRFLIIYLLNSYTIFSFADTTVLTSREYSVLRRKRVCIGIIFPKKISDFLSYNQNIKYYFS